MGRKHNRLKNILPRKTPGFNIREREKDHDDKHPIFSFKHMRYGNANCVSQCSKEDKAAIIGILVKLSQYKWKQIATFPREQYGSEPIPRDQFSVSLPPIVTPDVEKLQVFRYSDEGRIAGFRELDIFHILVVGNKLYPH